MMKKNVILILFLFCCNAIILPQSINHSQNLIDMLMKSACFQAWDYEKHYHDSISKETSLFYQYRMNDFLNRPDSAAVCLERLFDKYPYFMMDNGAKLNFLNVLINLYNETEDYVKVVDTYNRAEQLIRTGSFNNGENWKVEQLALLDQFRKEAEKKTNSAKLHITKIGSQETSVEFTESPFITIPIMCDGKRLQAIIDTGSGYDLLINPKRIEKTSPEVLPSPVDSLPFNGKMLGATRTLVDSMSVGNILFTNVPAFVVHDRYSSSLPDNILTEQQKIKYDSIMSSYDAVIGLPLLRKMGCVELDWEKKEARIRTQEDVSMKKEKPNLYISGGILYAEVSVNNIPYIGVLDTGAANTFIDLNRAFYESHKDALDVCAKEEENLMVSIAVASRSKRLLLQKPVISFDSKIVDSGKEEVAIMCLDHDSALSVPIYRIGGMGKLFIKQLGKRVNLDFVNMRLEAL